MNLGACQWGKPPYTSRGAIWGDPEESQRLATTAESETQIQELGPPAGQCT